MVVVIIVIINENNDNSKFYRSEETPSHDHWCLQVETRARQTPCHSHDGVDQSTLHSYRATAFSPRIRSIALQHTESYDTLLKKCRETTGTKYYQCHIPIMVQFFVAMTTIGEIIVVVASINFVIMKVLRNENCHWQIQNNLSMVSTHMLKMGRWIVNHDKSCQAEAMPIQPILGPVHSPPPLESLKMLSTT